MSQQIPITDFGLRRGLYLSSCLDATSIKTLYDCQMTFQYIPHREILAQTQLVGFSPIEREALIGLVTERLLFRRFP